MLWRVTCDVMVAVVLVAVLAPPSHALFGIPEFLTIGGCANVTLKPNFDPVKYTGLWFDIESVPNEYQHTKNCVTQNYNWTGDAMMVATKGLTAEGKKVRQGAVMHKETASTSDPDPAYMTVIASGVPEAPYQIIATDYRTYSCVYSCLEYFGFKAEFAWVFGRTPTLPTAAIMRCHDTLTGMGVDPKKMNKILQGSECPYFEKLEGMLAESEQYLLKILGPYVPTTTIRPAPTHHDQTILEVFNEEKKMFHDLEGQMQSGFSELHTDSQRNDGAETSVRDDKHDSAPGSSHHPVAPPLLSLLLLPFLIH